MKAKQLGFMLLTFSASRNHSEFHLCIAHKHPQQSLDKVGKMLLELVEGCERELFFPVHRWADQDNSIAKIQN